MIVPTRFVTWQRATGAAAIMTALPASAQGHSGVWQAGDVWWQAWHFDPLVGLNLLLVGAVYSQGIRKLWRQAGTGRGTAVWQAAAFYGGLVAVLLALMSPLDTLGEELSWVHMVQHMVLMVVAAPLLILGAPGFVVTWAMPRRWRTGSWRLHPRGTRRIGWRSRVYGLLWNAPLIWMFHAVVLWGWHLPAAYELALADPLVHDIEHLSFFLAACLFWRIVLDARTQLRLNPGLGVLYLFTTSLHSMVLGVFMALSPVVWYSTYSGRTEPWGLTPLEDQQLAGLIMWMPACAVYAVVAAGLFISWLGALDPPDGDRPAAERLRDRSRHKHRRGEMPALSSSEVAPANEKPAPTTAKPEW